MDLAGAVVELVGDGIQVVLTESAQICPFGQVLAQEPIGVFIAAPLPGAARFADFLRAAELEPPSAPRSTKA